MANNTVFSDSLWSLFSPNKVLIGVGAAKKTGEEVRELGGKRALIVTDPTIAAKGLIEEARDSMLELKIGVRVFDGVEIETPSRVVDELGRTAREGGFDVIVGIGGGSTLDTAKGASIMATNKGSVLGYVGTNKVRRRGLPKVLLPTTLSGSEVTRVFAPRNESAGTKEVVYTNFNFADVAIIDPLLTLSMPPSLVAETAIDALATAVETYTSIKSTPFSDLLAMEAIRIIGKMLPVAYSKGENVTAKSDLCTAALFANLAWQSGGLAAVHALTFALETECGLSHARACAIMLPHVMQYNLIGNLRRHAEIAAAMGEHAQGLNDFQAAECSVTAVKRLLETVRISFRLSDYGLKKEKVTKLVQSAMQQSKLLFVQNPRDLVQKDVEEIYLRALG